jgi:hypothetical protein
MDESATSLTPLSPSPIKAESVSPAQYLQSPKYGPSIYLPRAKPPLSSSQSCFLPICCANATVPPSTIANIISFLHVALFSPALSTLYTTLDAGRLTSTWPKITSALVCHHPPKSIAMMKGHLNQSRSNQCRSKTDEPDSKPISSSKPNSSSTSKLSDIAAIAIKQAAIAEDLSSTSNDQTSFNVREIFVLCHKTTGKIYSDPTGRSVAPSSSGNNYMLVFCDNNINYIHAALMKNRSSPEIITAYKRVHILLSACGL